MRLGKSTDGPTRICGSAGPHAAPVAPRDGFTSGLSTCASTCFTSAVSQSGCSSNDPVCLCESNDFINDWLDCTEETCSVEDIDGAGDALAKVCADPLGGASTQAASVSDTGSGGTTSTRTFQSTAATHSASAVTSAPGQTSSLLTTPALSVTPTSTLQSTESTISTSSPLSTIPGISVGPSNSGSGSAVFSSLSPSSATSAAAATGSPTNTSDSHSATLVIALSSTLGLSVVVAAVLSYILWFRRKRRVKGGLTSRAGSNGCPPSDASQSIAACDDSGKGVVGVRDGRSSLSNSNGTSESANVMPRHRSLAQYSTIHITSDVSSTAAEASVRLSASLTLPGALHVAEEPSSSRTTGVSPGGDGAFDSKRRRENSTPAASEALASLDCRDGPRPAVRTDGPSSTGPERLYLGELGPPCNHDEPWGSEYTHEEEPPPYEPRAED